MDRRRSFPITNEVVENHNIPRPDVAQKSTSLFVLQGLFNLATASFNVCPLPNLTLMCTDTERLRFIFFLLFCSSHPRTSDQCPVHHFALLIFSIKSHPLKVANGSATAQHRIKIVDRTISANGSTTVQQQIIIVDITILANGSTIAQHRIKIVNRTILANGSTTVQHRIRIFDRTILANERTTAQHRIRIVDITIPANRNTTAQHRIKIIDITIPANGITKEKKNIPMIGHGLGLVEERVLKKVEEKKGPNKEGVRLKFRGVKEEEPMGQFRLTWMKSDAARIVHCGNPSAGPSSYSIVFKVQVLRLVIGVPAHANCSTPATCPRDFKGTLRPFMLKISTNRTSIKLRFQLLCNSRRVERKDLNLIRLHSLVNLIHYPRSEFIPTLTLTKGSWVVPTLSLN
ncbi:hypothetical protein LguiA_033089 [Lonicera macranthoides]